MFEFVIQLEHGTPEGYAAILTHSTANSSRSCSPTHT